MSALSDLTQTSGASVTTLPSWYDQAQQNLLKEGQNAYAVAPQLGQTTAQQAINTLRGPANPFTQAQNTLGNIASGAANPWIVDQNTGAVTPNVNTAMGALFEAQRQQANQIMPNIAADPTAAGIGTGQFGSLRNLTAINKAKADYLTQLQAAQMQAALQNQQTGVTASTALGNVGTQGINAAMNVGKEQMTAPFTPVANYGNILASLTVPQTVKTYQTPSVLQQLGGLGSTAKGILSAQLPGMTSNIGQAISGGLSSLFSNSANTPDSSMTMDQLQPLLDQDIVVP